MEEILIQAIASTPSLVIAVVAWRLAERRADRLEERLAQRADSEREQHSELVKAISRKFEQQNIKT